MPQAQVHAAGLHSITNLIVRRRYGVGLTIALNAHGESLGLKLAGSVELHFTYNEEFGTVHGKMAHAAIPQSGVDALHGAVLILNALYAQSIAYRSIRHAKTWRTCFRRTHPGHGTPLYTDVPL